MTDVNQVIRLVQNHLSQVDIPPQAEAATIVAHVLGISRGRPEYLALAERLDAKAVEQITQLAKARATRTPLQFDRYRRVLWPRGQGRTRGVYSPSRN